MAGMNEMASAKVAHAVLLLSTLQPGGHAACWSCSQNAGANQRRNIQMLYVL